MAASQCAVLRCCSEDRAAARQPRLGTKTVQILQAQPGTLQALQRAAITLIPVLPSFLPLPWPHKSIACEHRCSLLFLCVFTQLRCMWDLTLGKGTISSTSVLRQYLDTTSSILYSHHQRNSAEFDQRNYWKEQSPIHSWYLSVSTLSGKLSTSPSAVSIGKLGWAVLYLKVKLNVGFTIEFCSILSSQLGVAPVAGDCMKPPLAAVG